MARFCGVFAFSADKMRSEKFSAPVILPTETCEKSLRAATLTACESERQLGALFSVFMERFQILESCRLPVLHGQRALEGIVDFLNALTSSGGSATARCAPQLRQLTPL